LGDLTEAEATKSKNAAPKKDGGPCIANGCKAFNLPSKVCREHDGYCKHHCPCADAKELENKGLTKTLPLRVGKIEAEKKIIKIYEDEKYTVGSTEKQCSDMISFETLLALAGDDIEYYRKNMPSKEVRHSRNFEEKLEESNPRMKGTIVSFFIELVKKIARSLVPRASDYLLRMLLIDLSPKASSKERSMETIVKNMFQLAQILPLQSISFKTLRAVLVQSVPPRKLTEDFDYMNPPYFGKLARTKGKTDFHTLRIRHEDPIVKKRSVKRIQDEAVKAAVLDILSKKNVMPLAYGTIKVKLSNASQYVTLPRNIRTRPISEMYKDYNKSNMKVYSMMCELKKTIEKDGLRMLGESTYTSIASAITEAGDKHITSVDYVVDRLVNEPLIILRQIVDDIVAPKDKQVLRDRLSLVANFLKYQYDNHVTMEDGICSHGCKYGLTHPSKVTFPEGRDVRECPGCAFIEYFMRVQLPEAVEESQTQANNSSVDDALAYIADTAEKFVLYQAHRTRVVNARQRIQSLENEAYKECEASRADGSIAIITIDWKMKFEAIRTRESSQHHYGKRGLGWHIVHFVYFVWDVEKDKPSKVSVTLDQILGTGNRQDGFAVLGDLEALMKLISKELPFLKKGWLKSDNANCYHNKYLILSIPVLNAMSKMFQIERLFHTEVQDGKGPCDSHGAIAHQRVKRFILKRSDKTELKTVCTPSQLAEAIGHNNGLKNSGIQLVNFDQSVDEAIQKMFEPCKKRADEYFSRSMEILFLPSNDKVNWKHLDLTEPENWQKICFRLRVWAYSGIGDGQIFEANIGNGTFRPQTAGVTFDLERNEELVFDKNMPPARIFDSFDDDTDASDDDASECDNDINKVIYFDGDGIKEDDNDYNDTEGSDRDDDDDDDDTNIEDDANATGKKFTGKPPENYYEKAFTGITVPYHQTFGKLENQKEKEKRFLEGRIETDSDKEEVTIQRDAKTTAILFAASAIENKEVDIRDVYADMPEYKLTDSQKDQIPADNYTRKQGWARRSEEKLYGTSYMNDQFKAFIKKCFVKGAEASSDKMNPSVIVEKLKEAFPELYRIPGESAVSQHISSLFKEQKDGTLGNQRRQTLSTIIPVAILERIDSIMTHHPGETGAQVEARVRQSFLETGGLPNGYSRLDVMKRVNTLNAKKRKALQKQQKQLLIG
jgi:hypothetical protein